MRPLLILVSLCTCSALSAQESRFEAGLAGGAFIYQGDLARSPAGSYRTARPMVTVWAARQVSNQLSFRGSFSAGSLHGDDALYTTPEWRSERALNFTTSLAEVSVLAVWDISGGRSVLAPYVFAGVGYVFATVNRDASHFNNAYFLNDKATEGLATDMARTPPKGLAVVPVGIGVRYALSERLSVNAETNYRLSHTDYLDGFSEAGNPAQYDHYQSYSVGISYRFDRIGGGKGRNQSGCPVFRQ